MTLRSIEYYARTKAPTMDDLYRAVQEDRLFGTETVRKYLTGAFKMTKDLPVEQFNFGTLPYKVIREAQLDAIEFIKYGLFKQPYPMCLYRCNIEYKDQVVGTSILTVEADKKTVLDADYRKVPPIAAVYFTHSDDHVLAQHSINMMAIHPSQKREGDSVEIQLPHEEYDYWRGKMRATKNGIEGQPPDPDDLCDGALIAMGLTMILNTKGVHKERTAPPRKPNMARSKTGRPLLPYVTHVYTKVYARSTTDPNEVTKGTHASPRPHRRRAHVRHYERGVKGEPGYREWWTPVEAMLVNWDGQPLQRGEYEVD